MKSIVMIFVTFLLNLLCEGGLTIVSWIIVFIPFILMTVIVTMLLYIFGLNATTGQANYSCKKYPDNITIDENNNIIIYDPDYNYLKNPAYYKKPNIFIPNPNPNANANASIYTSQPQGNTQVSAPSFYSSDPSYQS
jgi:hypothetical protein